MNREEFPRLPDPNRLFPPTPRRRWAPERPRTLDVVARPRPSPRLLLGCRGSAQAHGNPESPAHTASTETPPTAELGGDPATPTPFSPNLLDQLDEGQSRDGTVPLCEAQIVAKEAAAPSSCRPGFRS